MVPFAGEWGSVALLIETRESEVCDTNLVIFVYEKISLSELKVQSRFSLDTKIASAVLPHEDPHEQYIHRVDIEGHKRLRKSVRIE